MKLFSINILYKGESEASLLKVITTKMSVPVFHFYFIAQFCAVLIWKCCEDRSPNLSPVLKLNCNLTKEEELFDMMKERDRLRNVLIAKKAKEIGGGWEAKVLKLWIDAHIRPLVLERLNHCDVKSEMYSVMKIHNARVSPWWGLFWRHCRFDCLGSQNTVFPCPKLD